MYYVHLYSCYSKYVCHIFHPQASGAAADGDPVALDKDGAICVRSSN